MIYLYLQLYFLTAFNFDMQKTRIRTRFYFGVHIHASKCQSYSPGGQCNTEQTVMPVPLNLAYAKHLLEYHTFVFEKKKKKEEKGIRRHLLFLLFSSFNKGL